MSFYDNILKDDEQLIKVVRSYPLVFAWPVLLGLALTLLPFFLIVPLFKTGVLGLSGFGLLLLTGLVILTRALVMAYYNSFIITDRRVIDWDQRGLFDKVISEAEYDKVQDISYRIKGLWGTALNYGIIQIQTAGAAPVLELRYVRQPARIQALIAQIKRNYTLESQKQPSNFYATSRQQTI